MGLDTDANLKLLLCSDSWLVCRKLETLYTVSKYKQIDIMSAPPCVGASHAELLAAVAYSSFASDTALILHTPASHSRGIGYPDSCYPYRNFMYLKSR
jgi:hypothetical protein